MFAAFHIKLLYPELVSQETGGIKDAFVETWCNRRDKLLTTVNISVILSMFGTIYYKSSNQGFIHHMQGALQWNGTPPPDHTHTTQTSDGDTLERELKKWKTFRRNCQRKKRETMNNCPRSQDEFFWNIFLAKITCINCRVVFILRSQCL